MDEELQSLINEVCQYPEQTPERQKALHQLLIAVQKLPGILRSNHQDYLLALNKTWEWVCRNICTFEPRSPSLQESLISWINGYLRFRIKDILSPDNHYVISLDQPWSNNDGPQVTLSELLPDSESKDLDLLERKIAQLQEKKLQRIGQKVRQQMVEDKQRKLRACHPRKYPECHCQLLAQRLVLQEPPDRIADIAREFNINNQGLYAHWKRKCLPLLQNIARNSGYEQ
ncbi:MAG: hypothetical protein KME49_21630 [Brasilonema octagenarum HA4186-MV1]|uniref:Sigma-70 family RNA polymerase sigma factor n=2 Tax=Brasilonema TaxID=383614 RepID=A0A856MFN0_9CYAN|nr:hypothetical protein [Brasilonema sennae]MBW4628037.1 hypothetical protein [Brasilonema octagenarum HA4186-MV1]NMF61275.1 hypothetical protein [Brasilonema octagenarum UFV-OR1]QDL09094.1 hypothetical protein DP114_15355 [Brasilonema sennae CENA114]QDL15452.1 hypothetical protein DP113_15295 [Brasilonema octagenarum UFV-E1]